MKKRVLAIALAIAMVFSTLQPMSVSASDVQQTEEITHEEDAEHVHEEDVVVEEVEENEEIVVEENATEEQETVVEESANVEEKQESVSNNAKKRTVSKSVEEEVEGIDEESSIKDFVIDDIKLIENASGYERTGGWYYYVLDYRYSITFSDGEVVEGTNEGLEHNDIYYSIWYEDNQSSQSPWKREDGPYEIAAFIRGDDGSEMSTTFTLEIIETPAESVSFENSYLTEGVDGYYDCDIYEEEESPDYFKYSYKTPFTIQLKSGDTLDSMFDEERDTYYVEYEGYRYTPQCFSEQSYEEQWIVREEPYSVNANIMGVEASYSIYICEEGSSDDENVDETDFIQDIYVEDMEYIEGTYGDMVEDEDGNEFYRYNPDQECTIYFTDGTDVTTENGYFEYNGEPYWIDWSFEQDYENQWTAGNSYTATVRVMGKSADCTVTILESPIEEIILEDRNCIENVDGYEHYDWLYDEETGEEYKANFYFRYYTSTRERIIFKSDAEVEIEDYGIYYHGRYYDLSLDYQSDQSYDNPWGVGSHTVTVSCLGYTTTYTVNVVESPIERIDFETVKIYEGMNRYYNENDECYYYQIPENSLKYTITFSDGTQETFEGFWIYYNDQSYSVECTSNETPDNLWEVGETYTAKALIMGKEYDVPVEILGSPVESVSISDVSVIENTHGGSCWGSYYDEDTDTEVETEWYKYDDFKVSFTVVMTDGKEISGTFSGFDVNYYHEDLDVPLQIDIKDTQSYENQWKVNEQYELSAMIAGKETSFNVSIIENPVTAISAETKEIIVGTDAYINDGYEDENGDWIEENWLEYIVVQPCSITLADGSNVESDGSCFVYEGQEYRIKFLHNQSYDNQWDVGEYTVDIDLLGVTGSYNVNIIEAPIKAIYAEPMTVIENTDGYWSGNWFSEDEYVKYFRYDYMQEVTIVFDDGTEVRTEEGGMFEYNGEWYSVDYDSQQSAYTPWEKGTNYVTVSVLGFSDTYEVDVVESPVEEIIVENIKIIEGMNRDFFWEYDDETDEEYEYEGYNVKQEFTVILKDGTELTSEWREVEYNDQWYSAKFTHDQRENEWGIGTHTVTLSVLGAETTYEVEIVETPVKDVKFEKAQKYEGTEREYNYDDGCYMYSIYSDDLKYTITFADGTVKEYEGWCFEYDGIEYELGVYTDESADNLWDVGIHTATARILGKEYEFEVEILETPIKSITLSDVEMIEYTNGEVYSDYIYNEENDELEDVLYYKYNKFEPEYTIEFKDGTTYTGEIGKNDEEICLDDINFGIKYFTEQDFENQWKPGNTYTVTADIGGVEATFNAKILESPVESFEIKPIDIVEYTNGYYETREYYDEESDEWFNEEYYYYDLEDYNFEYRIEFKSGQVLEGEGSEFKYNGKWYDLEEYVYLYPQGDEPWVAGEQYAIEVTLFGQIVEVPVNILECPYESIEILNVEPLRENRNCYMDEGVIIYEAPRFSYKVTLKDGSTFVGYSQNGELDINSYRYQYDDPWYPGKEGMYFIAKYSKIEVEVPVTMLPDSEYDYFEQDGQIYISGINLTSADIVIPSEIDGKPVVGVFALGLAGEYVVNLTVPDSVTMFDCGREWMSQLETITFGSGLNDIDTDMFSRIENLKEINVSEDNKYFASKDGILYNKDFTKLLAYPLAKGNDYNVPASVTDIDVLNGYAYRNININFSDDSDAFVTDDDVTYTKDKKKIVFCNPSKEGTYEIPDTVTEIAASAFENCNNLTEVTLPEGITSVVYGAFANCKNLTQITIPQSVKAIEESAFYNCRSLEEVELPDSLESIGNKAFLYSGLNGITLPETLKSIDGAAFKFTNIGEEVTIPDSVTSLGEYVFANCQNLKKVNVGAGVSHIPSEAFNCSNNLNTVVLKNENVSVGVGAFGVTALENMTFENIKGKIDWSAFANTALKELNLAEGVTSVAYCAFNSCYDLAAISMPESIERVEAHSFAETEWMESQEDGVAYIDNVLYSYVGHMLENTEITVEEGTKVIADAAFENQKNLTKITLPEGLKTIGLGAFAGCTNLKEISIPASVTNIEDSNFLQCTSLSKIEVAEGNSVYKVIDGVLYSKDGKELIYCPNLDADSYTVPYQVEKIHTNAFSNSGINNIIILNSKTEIEERAIGFDGYYQFEVMISGQKDSTAESYAKDNLYEFTEIEGCVHSWDDGEPITIPTCDTDGESLFTCGKCGETKKEVVDALGHDWTAADCETAKTCSVCGETEGEALGHSWNDATCTEAKTCSVCGETEGEALGHSWNEATCTEAKTCSVCGETEGEALDHDLVEVAEIAATCTEEGSTAGHNCSRCDYTDGQETIEALGHSWSEATCTEAKTCSVCGETEGEALGHDLVEVAEIAATCTEEGATAGHNCSRCDYTDGQEAIEALGHSWSEATCTEAKTCSVCGETEGEALGHSWSDATCTEAKICSVCGETEGEALGHNWTEITCGELTAKECDRCGETEGDILEHDWTDATCTEAKTCSVCGITEGDPLGHDWQEPTCEEAEFCTRCYVVGRDMLGHTPETMKAVKATMDKAGKTAGSKCSVCDKILKSQKTVARISSASLSTTKLTYNGSNQVPTLTVKDVNKIKLVKGEDYKVDLPTKRSAVGRYSVKVTFTGDYSGSVTLNYTIVPKAPSSASAKLYGYDDIKVSWSKVSNASGYFVYYKKSTSSGYTYLTRTTSTSVKKANLTDGARYYFKIVPYYKSGETRYSSLKYITANTYTLKKVSTPSVVKSGTKVKVSWTNINGETGYQISRSTSKTGTNIVSTYATTTGKSKTVSATKNKTYYYKVRAYKTVDGEKIYGPWSSVKSYKRK